MPDLRSEFEKKGFAPPPLNGAGATGEYRMADTVEALDIRAWATSSCVIREVQRPKYGTGTGTFNSSHVRRNMRLGPEVAGISSALTKLCQMGAIEKVSEPGTHPIEYRRLFVPQDQLVSKKAFQHRRRKKAAEPAQAREEPAQAAAAPETFQAVLDRIVTDMATLQALYEARTSMTVADHLEAIRALTGC